MATNRSAPSATVVPVLIYEDVEQAIDWLCRAFGFTERLRAERNGVIGHAQLTVAEGDHALCQGGPFHAPQASAVSEYVHITVANVDSHFEHSTQCGARVVEAPADMPFGERQYTVQDHAGHWWTFSQHVADLSPEDWGAVFGHEAVSEIERVSGKPSSDFARSLDWTYDDACRQVRVST